MKELDTILDECLDQLINGASTVDECLARYPEHAAQLRPLLNAALRAQRGGVVSPSTAFKARTRSQLMVHTRSHPRMKRGVPLWQAALSIAALMIAFLIIGTTFAQGALPGEGLYHWKLSSENAWRSVSPDPLAVDLGIAHRRVNEMVAVAGDEVRVIEALEGYKVLLVRFQSDQAAANQERIVPVLSSQRERLAQAGLLIPELDNYFLVDNQIEGGTLPNLDTPVTPEPASH